MIFLQLILLCFALFMIYVLYLHWKRHEIPSSIFLIWIIIWMVFIFINFTPQTLNPITKIIPVLRVMDLAMIAAFMVLTYITIENNIKIKKYEHDLQKLVRKLTIKNGKTK